MENNLKKKTVIPLILSIALLWVIIIIPLNISVNQNNGHIIYSLDDAYIHLAIAKHLSQDGVFGVTKYKFTPSSSSPLWTLLLSLFFLVFGVNEAIPLILNTLIATLFLIIIYNFLRKRDFSNNQIFICLSVFIFLIPLPYLVFTGLEHILQILLISIFLIGISETDNISKLKEKYMNFPSYIYIVGFLSVATRYESLFLIGIFSTVLFFKKEYLKSFLIFLSGTLPVIIYGIISTVNGWYFIPNSILLKGNKFNILSLKSIALFLYNGMRQLVYNIHLLVLFIIIILLLLLFNKIMKKNERKYLLPAFLFITVSTLHLLFAKTGLFLSINYQIRYDTYLLVMGLIIILLMPLKKLCKFYGNDTITKIILYFLLITLVLPFAERSFKILYKLPDAMSNTYSNQYLFGKFVNKYYKNESILVNDIGGVNFLTDIRCLDILGLSSKKPAELFIKNKMNVNEIDRLSKLANNKIAIVNDDLLRLYGGIPKRWTLIAQWKLKKSVISPLDTISFYACNNENVLKLSKSMKEFAKTLPDTLYFRILR